MFVDMNPSNSPRTGLTVPAAAARAEVDTTAIRDAIGRGELPARERFTLVIDPSDLDAWNAQRIEKAS